MFLPSCVHLSVCLTVCRIIKQHVDEFCEWLDVRLATAD